MGCQTKIVEMIVAKKANYLIGLKGNQGTLNEGVRLFFDNPASQMNYFVETEIDKGHDRIETRQCTVTEEIAWLQEHHPKWKHLKSVIEIKSQREVKGEVSVEKRYYINSLPAQADKILKVVRHHWGVENKLHWVLDIVFNDDQCRIRKGTSKYSDYQKNSAQFITTH